jgi:hypothetical protein
MESVSVVVVADSYRLQYNNLNLPLFCEMDEIYSFRENSKSQYKLTNIV